MRYILSEQDWYRGARYEDYNGREMLDNFMPPRQSGADRMVSGSTNDGESFPKGPGRSNGSKGAV